MEKAIKKAIEGGWKEGKQVKTVKYVTHDRINVCVGERSDPEEFLKPQEYLLDPDFWQYLGKAEGWPQKLPQPYQTGNGNWIDITWWEYKWHEFIRHLADGGNVDDFFNNLLK